MKKLLLSLAVALGAISVNAQEAGSMWVGGTVGFTYEDIKGSTSFGSYSGSQTSYKILPEFGYVLSENLALGISVGYIHTEERSDENLLGKHEGFVAAPFLRSSFLKGSMGSLFIDTGVDYAHLKSGGTKSDLLQIGFKPGVAVTVSEKISLIGKFGFLGYTHAKEGAHKTNGYGFDFDLSNIQLGAAINF